VLIVRTVYTVSYNAIWKNLLELFSMSHRKLSCCMVLYFLGRIILLLFMYGLFLHTSLKRKEHVHFYSVQ
jgi:hypothetical protein